MIVTMEQIEIALVHLPVYIKSYNPGEVHERESSGQTIIDFWTKTEV